MLGEPRCVSTRVLTHLGSLIAKLIGTRPMPAKTKEEDPRRFLHPETIARISRLDLRARHVVEGFISGMHRSPFFGHSVEFIQHRVD